MPLIDTASRPPSTRWPASAASPTAMAATPASDDCSATIQMARPIDRVPASTTPR